MSVQNGGWSMVFCIRILLYKTLLYETKRSDSQTQLCVSKYCKGFSKLCFEMFTRAVNKREDCYGNLSETLKETLKIQNLIM